MQIAPNRTARRVPMIAIAVATLAAACAGSPTVTESGTEVEPTTVSVEPAPDPTATSAASEEPTPVAVQPTTAPAPAAEPAKFRADNILAISDRGELAYGGTTSPWVDETSCNAAPAESLAVVGLLAGDAGTAEPVAAGLVQVGDVRQMLINANHAAIVSSCGSTDEPTLTIQRAELGSDGRLVNVTSPIVLPVTETEGAPYFLRWVDDQVIEARVISQSASDSSEWVFERRHVNPSTGEVVFAETYEFDDSLEIDLLTLPNGVIYRSVPDPNGAVGCEGAGVARTIEIEDGAGERFALGEDGPVFSDVNNLHIGQSGHIAWTSGCEGFRSAFVGKLLADGSIIDAHFVESRVPDGPSGEQIFADYQVYRLTDDGFLAGVGVTFDAGGDEPKLAFLRYDLATDPHFVNTADPRPQIEQAALFMAVDGQSSWHVGETLGTPRACGGMTLYAQTSTGFVRAFVAGRELDAIVAADVAAPHATNYEDGTEFLTRTVVVQTECPGEYDGRRVWFGTETENVHWGLYLDRADLGEVRDVVSVRDVLGEGGRYIEASVVEVELFDGTVTEIELVALAADN